MMMYILSAGTLFILFGIGCILWDMHQDEKKAKK